LRKPRFSAGAPGGGGCGGKADALDGAAAGAALGAEACGAPAGVAGAGAAAGAGCAVWVGFWASAWPAETAIKTAAKTGTMAVRRTANSCFFVLGLFNITATPHGLLSDRVRCQIVSDGSRLQLKNAAGALTPGAYLSVKLGANRVRIAAQPR
jgi:hypothetical protein